MLFKPSFALFGALLALVKAAPSLIEKRPTSGEVPATREYFYVGGNYVPMGTEHIFANQMYVEKLTPSNPCQPWPLVFIHGQGQSGTNWLNKPDGGSGWATYFLKQGYIIYIIDQTERARSPWNPAGNTTLTTYTAEDLQRRFTATQNYNLWPQAGLHTQWNGVSSTPFSTT
jgi:pimeloyl-ACP methyl ester carboxylesterase